MAARLKVSMPAHRSTSVQKLIQIRLDSELVEKIKKMKPKSASCPAKVKAIVLHVMNDPEVNLEFGK